MPPCGRRLALPTSLPPWAVLLSGVMLGCVLTSTFTFHLRWCSDDRVSLGDLSLERQTLSIIRVNEHIRAHGKVDGRWERNADGGGDVESEWDDCVCGDELKRLKGANEAYTVDWGKRSKPAVDPTHMASHYLTKPSVITFKADWNSSNSDDDLVFLNLAAAEGERSVSWSRPCSHVHSSSLPLSLSLPLLLSLSSCLSLSLSPSLPPSLPPSIRESSY